MWQRVRTGAPLRQSLAVLLTTVLVSCGVVNLFTLDDDVSMGKQMDQEIKSTPAQYPILQNEAIRGYLQGIVNRIKASPKMKYANKFPYAVTVINDDKTINAFCTPGGFIYVYTGLLRFMDNEATLAGVLGHEIGHAEARHSSEQMTTQLGAEVALSIALGKNPSQLAQVAGNAGVLLATLKNSRDDEAEADELSFTYLRSTSYYPGAVKFFFEKMMQTGSQSPSGLASWLSTHPTDQSRLDHINSLLKSNNIPAPTEATLMSQQFRNAMASLR